jgi:hypothetical protein
MFAVNVEALEDTGEQARFLWERSGLSPAALSAPPNNICLWAAKLANLTGYRISNLRPAGRKSIWGNSDETQ